VVGAAVPAAVCRWGLCPCCPGVGEVSLGGILIIIRIDFIGREGSVGTIPVYHRPFEWGWRAMGLCSPCLVAGAAVPAAVCRWGLCSRCDLVGGGVCSGVNTSLAIHWWLVVGGARLHTHWSAERGAALHMHSLHSITDYGFLHASDDGRSPPPETLFKLWLFAFWLWHLHLQIIYSFRSRASRLVFCLRTRINHIKYYFTAPAPPPPPPPPASCIVQ